MFSVFCEFPKSELGTTVLTVQFHAAGQGEDLGQWSERQGPHLTKADLPHSEPLGRLRGLGCFEGKPGISLGQ